MKLISASREGERSLLARVEAARGEQHVAKNLKLAIFGE